MTTSLHHLFGTLAIAHTESELRDRLMDNISQHFGVQRWISANTVKQALKKMLLKLEVRSRTEMAIKIIKIRQLTNR